MSNREKLEEIKGIGAVYAELLIKHNISSLTSFLKAETEDLVRMFSDASPRITPQKIEDWKDDASAILLSRQISGISKDLADKLVEHGIKTVKTLLEANSTSLATHFKSLGDDVSETDITNWQYHARVSQQRLPIVFVDMARRDQKTRKEYEDEISRIDRGYSTASSESRRDERNKALSRIVADPLFNAIKEAFAETNQFVSFHKKGKFSSQEDREPLDKDEISLAAVYGILQRDHITKPKAGLSFNKGLAFARGEYNQNKDLFNRVLEVLIDESNGYEVDESAGYGAGSAPAKHIDTEQWATVVRTLVTQKVLPTDEYLALHTTRALSSHIAADDDAPGSSLEINLPDLEHESSVEILEDNIRAMQAIYFSAVLEDLKLFQVVDKLIELFQVGMLPLGKSRAGDLLFKRMKVSVERFSEYDRRNLYARTLGFPGGEAIGMINRDFQILWLRFISAISSFARQRQVDTLLRSEIPVRVSQEQIRKSGRDLAANLSLHGFSIAHYAAVELERQIKEDIEILSDPDVMGAYGAKDMYGVIDQVAALELGGPRDSIRYRTMASSGAVIIRWLANNAKNLASINSPTVLDMQEIAMPEGHRSGSSAMINPHASDLVNACERWLAVTGTPDKKIESYADPYEGPTLTSRPVQIPSIAQDMLESVGVGSI